MSTQPIVLLVEDNEDIREGLAEILGQEGYACWPAASADDAVALLNRARDAPHVILLDLLMPGMPAPDFVAQLKASPAWASIPVLMVTASSTPPTLAVDGVLTKPFQIPQLLTRMRELVSVAASGRDAAGP